MPGSDQWQDVSKLAAAGVDAQSLETTLARLLHLLRVHVGMEVAWVSEFTRAAQVVRIVDVEPGKQGPAAGTELPLNGSYCVNVLTGRMPAKIPDARTEPLAAMLPVSHELHIGSYLGVPLRDITCNVVGMLCATSSTASPSLDDRDLASVRLMAEMIEDFTKKAADQRETEQVRRALIGSIEALVAGHGRRSVLQPVVDLECGQAVLVEGLTRFDDAGRTPAQWFDAAWMLGLGPRLEVATAISVLDATKHEGSTAVAVNVSPQTVIEGYLDELLAGVDRHRVVLEITEHAPVTDYEALHAALAPHRAAGVLLAVDDAGAGYSSLVHILRLAPEIMKVDMALVRGVDADPARQALVTAMVAFGAGAGCQVVAEGVETAAELAMLRSLGIRYAQGFLFGQPTEALPTDRLYVQA